MKTVRVTQVLALAGVGCRGATFDYIIAGAGTSGLVVANRLSENPAITVAVIEPGQDVRNDVNVTSVLSFQKAFFTSIDWQYQTAPQTSAAGQSLTYHSGKAIGGTSTINGMTYIRGDRAELDAWEKLGNRGWNWDALWSHYKGAENFTIPTADQTADGASYIPKYHGESGKLHTGYPFELYSGSLTGTIEQTWKDLGYSLNQDPNGGSVAGFSVWPQTLDRDADVREDAARAFYYPVEGRPNLKIINGTVKRIVWNNESSQHTNKLADGVEYVSPLGDIVQLQATREVILSAGSVRSPLILELSGVGNSQLLTKFGIDTVIDLPGVGENLQDQALAGVEFTSPVINTTDITPYATFVTALDLFGDQLAEVASSTKANLSSWAQQVAAANNNAVNASALERIFEVQQELIFSHNVTLGEILSDAATGITISPLWPLLPFSRGSVHLNSSTAIDAPVIDPKYFLIDFDLITEIAMCRLAQKFWTQDSMASLELSQVAPSVPSNATDDQWAAGIYQFLTPNHHAIGSASMMARELGGVVDPELTVYGTSNVRVVDASILPLQVSGHLTATLYAVADRASDIIIGSQGYSTRDSSL